MAIHSMKNRHHSYQIWKPLLILAQTYSEENVLLSSAPCDGVSDDASDCTSDQQVMIWVMHLLLAVVWAMWWSKW